MISFRESTWTSKYTLSCWQQRFDCPKVHKHPSSLTATCLPNLNPIWLRFARFVTTSFNTAAHTVSIIYIYRTCAMMIKEFRQSETLGHHALRLAPLCSLKDRLLQVNCTIACMARRSSSPERSEHNNQQRLYQRLHQYH